MSKRKDYAIIKRLDKAANGYQCTHPVNVYEKFFKYDNCQCADIENGFRAVFFDDPDNDKPNIYLKTEDGVKCITSMCVFYKPEVDCGALGLMGKLIETTTELDESDILFMQILLHPFMQIKLKQEYEAQNAKKKQKKRNTAFPYGWKE